MIGQSPRSPLIWLPLLTGGLACALVLSLGIGSVPLAPAQVVQALLRPNDQAVRAADIAIVWDLRLARALLAACVGAGLAGARRGVPGAVS